MDYKSIVGAFGLQIRKSGVQNCMLVLLSWSGFNPDLNNFASETRWLGTKRIIIPWCELSYY